MSGLPPPETIEDEKIETEKPAAEATPTARKRGRPRGSTNATGNRARKTTQRKAQDAKDLAKNIQGVHGIIAVTTGLHELQINEAEAETIATALQAVCDEYGFELSGKTGAAVQLFAAAGMVYVPRILVIKARMDAERAKNKEGATDVQFNNEVNNGVSPHS